MEHIDFKVITVSTAYELPMSVRESTYRIGPFRVQDPNMLYAKEFTLEPGVEGFREIIVVGFENMQAFVHERPLSWFHGDDEGNYLAFFSPRDDESADPNEYLWIPPDEVITTERLIGRWIAALGKVDLLVVAHAVLGGPFPFREMAPIIAQIDRIRAQRTLPPNHFIVEVVVRERSQLIAVPDDQPFFVQDHYQDLGELTDHAKRCCPKAQWYSYHRWVPLVSDH